MNRLLLVGFAAVALSMAACSDNDNNGNDGGTTTDAGTTDAGTTDAGTTDGGTTDGGTTDGGTDAGVPTGSATINGTIPGTTNFVPVDAIVDADLQDTSSALIAISDVANSCTLAQGNITPKNAQLLGIQLHNQVSGQDAPLTAGTYNITTDPTTPDGLSAQSSLITSDQTCQTSVGAVATGGTVTVTTLNATAGGSIEGSFSLEFPNLGTTNTTVTGTFIAPLCDTSGAPTTSTCQP